MKRMFEEKVILITGSSRGIGAATARLAASRGAHVIVHGHDDSEELHDIAKELAAPYVVADVQDKAAVNTAVAQALKYHGCIDYLVNNAGAGAPKPFLESDDDNWEFHLHTNVLGVVHFCQAVIPHMLKQKHGGIVNTASIRGHAEAASNRTMAYSASKAAVINLTSALAKEYAPLIRVNAVAPGFTETAMAKTFNDTVWKQVNSALLGRIAQPNEIAEALLFLLSDRASFITGQTLTVDGGYEIAGK